VQSFVKSAFQSKVRAKEVQTDPTLMPELLKVRRCNHSHPAINCSQCDGEYEQTASLTRTCAADCVARIYRPFPNNPTCHEKGNENL
jgi:hypothetical protein